MLSDLRHVEMKPEAPTTKIKKRKGNQKRNARKGNPKRNASFDDGRVGSVVSDPCGEPQAKMRMEDMDFTDVPGSELWVTELTEEVMFRNNIEAYKMYAMAALQRFNSSEGVDFELVEVKFGYTEALPQCISHVNFYARPVAGGTTDLFFAELEVPSAVKGMKISDVTALCCCRLKVTDQNQAGTSFGSLIYPLPICGHDVASGDRFHGVRLF